LFLLFFLFLPDLLPLRLLSGFESLAPVTGADHLIAFNNLIAKGTVRGLEQRPASQARALARLIVVGAPFVADTAPFASPPFPSSHRPLSALACPSPTSLLPFEDDLRPLAVLHLPGPDVTLVGEAVVTVAADDEVIEDLYPHELGGEEEFPRDGEVMG
jgi:hypothetical protein